MKSHTEHKSSVVCIVGFEKRRTNDSRLGLLATRHALYESGLNIARVRVQHIKVDFELES